MPKIYTPEPATTIPCVEFCYADGHDIFYGTNFPPTEPTPACVELDGLNLCFTLTEPIEDFQFTVQDYGVVDIFLYSQPLTLLTGECIPIGVYYEIE